MTENQSECRSEVLKRKLETCLLKKNWREKQNAKQKWYKENTYIIEHTKIPESGVADRREETRREGDRQEEKREGFRSQDSGFRIQESAFRIQDSGVRSQESGLRIHDA